MDHNYIPSVSNPLLCAKCKRAPIDHSERATCECCPNVGKMNLLNGILMCDTCLENEKQAILDKQNTPKVEPKRESLEEFQQRLRAARDHNIAAGAIQPDPMIDPMPAGSGILNISNLVDKAREITSTIQSVPDLFNAKTTALHEVYAAMDADSQVTEKQYAKSAYTQNHIKDLQKVIFEANQTIIEANNGIRAAQSELSKLLPTLREEERAKLGLIAPNYKPGAVKSPKAAAKPRAPKKPKFDKTELIAVVKELEDAKVPGATLAGIQSICTKRDMTPRQAGEYWKKLMSGHA